MTVSLLLKCCECGADRKVLFGKLDKDVLGRELMRDGWLLSVITAPGTLDVVLAPLCGTCAERVHPPELLKAARKAMQK